MVGEWQETTIGEHVELATGEAFQSARFGTTPDSGTLLARGDNVKEGEFEWGEKSRYWPKLTPDLERYLLREGDVLLGMDGSKVGRNWVRVRAKDLPCLLVQRVARLRAKRTMDQGFLRYLIGNPQFRDYVARVRTGTSIPHISGGQIKSYEILLPPLAEQKAIAEVLGALDDKIELNRRMNATLEAIARALFQSWFVNFDPVRAKLDGREPVGMDEASAALFPDSFEESEVGHIPKGWRACALGDIAKNVSITFDFKRTPEVVFVNTGDVLEGDFLHSKRSDHVGLPGQAKKSIRPDDILFSEIRPANKRYAYVDFDSSDYVVSTKFMIIRGSKEIHPRLLYRILIANETLEEFQVQAESRSGTFPQITFDSISHLPIVLPPIEIQEAFQRAIGKMDDQIKVNKQQSCTLATLRDKLLPKLLSGELSVSNYGPEL
jgi:type I restriction enzyme S subunit